MPGHVFIARGDITRVSADALVYPASPQLSLDSGLLLAPFTEHVPGFRERYERLQRPQPLGSTHWIDLRVGPGDDRRPFGVIVVVSTGAGLTRGQEEHLFAQVPALRDEIERAAQLGGGVDPGTLRRRLMRTTYAAWAAIVEAATRLRRDHPRTGQKEPQPYLVALPTIGHGQGGNRRIPLASARVLLLAAHAALRGNDDLDVAFLPYTPHSYEVLLQARRGLDDLLPAGYPDSPGVGGGPGLAELAVRVEEAVRGRRCVLFVGSGLSTAAGFPSWDRLNEKLADALGILKDREAGEEFQRRKRDLDYSLDLAQWYADRYERDSPGALTRLVCDAYGNTEGRPVRPTLAHYLLTSLPTRLVVTTNYDDLLEQALLGLRRYPERIVRREDVPRTAGGLMVPVVKFHGDARTGARIVLKRDDYDRFFLDHPDMDVLLRGLLLNHTFVFVGYSLRDPNFLQVYNHVRHILGECQRRAFVVTVEEGRLTTGFQQAYWQARNVDVLAMPGKTFPERVGNSLRFLDWLAAQTCDGQSLVLARDVPLAPQAERVQPIREAVVGHADELSGYAPLLAGGLATADAATRRQVCRRVGQLLAFLSAHGWAPDGSRAALLRLWTDVAGLAPSDEERRQLLITAFQYAEAFHEVEDLRRRIDALTPPDCRP